MKIVILDHEPYSSVKKSNYFIDEFRATGTEIEYWSLVDMLPYTKILNYNYREHGEGIRYIKNKQSLLADLKKLDYKNVAVIVEFWFTPFTLSIFKTLRNKQIRWAKIDYYLNPTIALEPEKSFKQRIAELDLGNLTRKISTFIFSYLYGKSGLQTPDLLLVTGRNKNRLPASGKTVSIDYFDVLKYNEIKDSAPVLDFKYLVFLDTMLFDHPDILMYGYKQELDKNDYFTSLNKYFAKIESETGYKVVIASHPKASYSDEFEGRRCIKGLTAELVNYSEGVLTHGSLSISFALLARKPIVYIYSSELFVNNEFLVFTLNNMTNASSILNAPLIDIAKAGQVNFDSKVSVGNYDSYLDAYYKKDKLDLRNNFQIISDSLIGLIND